MAGINRLGKAPPKPGTLRPPDPNKYRTIDLYSEGAEGDIEYQRMVRDIEDMQQQQGWLFGRGAFDKADLLYLRDTAEQQRHKELELADRERSEFLLLRAKLDQQVEEGQLEYRHPPTGVGTEEADGKRKPVGAQLQPRHGGKVQKVGGGSSASVSQLEQQTDKEEEKAGSPFSESSGKNRGTELGGGLATLMGAYGSSDDEDEEQGSGGGPVQSRRSSSPTPVPSALRLPGASELLGLSENGVPCQKAQGGQEAWEEPRQSSPEHGEEEEEEEGDGDNSDSKESSPEGSP